MATTSPATAPDHTAWTQIDQLTNSIIVSVQNRDTREGQSMGIIIAVSQPSAGTAWDADGAWSLDPGGSDMWGKATGEHVWARMQTQAASPKPVVQEKV